MKRREYYTMEEATDYLIGTIGTPERDKFEAKVKAGLIGNAIRAEREAQCLSRKDVEDKLYLSRGLVARIEHGEDVSLRHIIYVISGLGMTGNLDMGKRGCLDFATKEKLPQLGVRYKTMSFDIPESMIEELDMKTFKLGISINEYVKRILEQNLAKD